MSVGSVVSGLFVACVLALTGIGCSGANQSIPAAPSPPPASQTFILFGVVTEATSSGAAPIAGVQIDVASCPETTQGSCTSGSRSTTSDAQGSYAMPGVYYGGRNTVWAYKAGFGFPPGARVDGEGAQSVTVTGDTRLDIQLVRH
jgi:hypothetical protein